LIKKTPKSQKTDRNVAWVESQKSSYKVIVSISISVGAMGFPVEEEMAQKDQTLYKACP